MSKINDNIIKYNECMGLMHGGPIQLYGPITLRPDDSAVASDMDDDNGLDVDEDSITLRSDEE